MKTETIDNVVYYVWKAGDELPSYQPIDAELLYQDDWEKSLLFKEDWGRYKYRWPKLINDRAQHQRMIDEAFDSIKDDSLTIDDLISCLQQIEYSTMRGDFTNVKCALSLLSARSLLLMEHVQVEIDKESMRY